MELKAKIATWLILSIISLSSADVLASSAASCTLNGSWRHQAAGSSQTCLSYVCCSNGKRAVWVAGNMKNADQWCQGWHATAEPEDVCNDATREVFSKMTLVKMTALTITAAEDRKNADDDDDENNGEVSDDTPLPEVQCRFDRECDGE